MNRFLTKLNLLGVFALAALCVFQWRINREANIDVIGLQKSQREQSAKIAEHEKTIAGHVVDLESFRAQLTATKNAEKELTSKLTAADRNNHQLTIEVEQLKLSLTTWAAAVSERDEQLRRATTNIQDLIASRDEAIEKYNGLAKQHNQLVADLNRAATNSTAKN
jgi:chromosome segregation ATPase